MTWIKSRPWPTQTSRRGARLLWRSARQAIVALALVQVVSAVAPAIVIYASGTLIDSAEQASESPQASRGVVLALLAITVALVLGRMASAAISFLHSLVSYRFATSVEATRMEAAGALPGLAHFDSQALADSLQAGQWASSASNLVNLGGSTLHWVFFVASSSLVATQIGWWAPTIALGSAIPASLVNWFHVGVRKDLQRSRVGSQRLANYHAELAFGSQPGRELRLFGLGDWLRGNQVRWWTDASQPVFAAMRQALRHGLALSLAKSVLVAVPFALAFARLMEGTITPGAFGAGVMALGAVLRPLRQLETLPGDLREAGQFLPELFALADLAVDDPRLYTAGRRTPTTRLALGLAFEQVQFTYPASKEPALNGLDLWLPAGGSLAVVGDNGSGKSTLVKLLCRFYDPDSGRITYDGVDIREFDLTAWRERLAVVFQDFLHLPLTVAENVGIGCVSKVNDRALLSDAADRSGVRNLIETLPHGWEEILSPQFGGADISGGEWQRVALARAFAASDGRDAPILVFDEPTAALDVRLEHELYQCFARLTAGRSTLLISHRLSTVRMVDQIAVLEGGHIREKGTHAELLKAGRGYAALYELQSEQFRKQGLAD